MKNTVAKMNLTYSENERTKTIQFTQKLQLEWLPFKSKCLWLMICGYCPEFSPCYCSEFSPWWHGWEVEQEGC